MKIKNIILVLSIVIVLASCAPVEEVIPTDTVAPSPVPSNMPSPTLDSIMQATVLAEWGIPAPTVRPGYPTPMVASLHDSGPAETQTDISLHELYIGKYVVRRWQVDQNIFRYTISSIGQPHIETNLISELSWGGLDPLTGIDITGEGNPEVIFHGYTGGNHCCHSVYVYDLGQTAQKVFELVTADYPGSFIDLDDDGIYEYVTCDPTFQYMDLTMTELSCSYASAPYPTAIFRYSPEQGYQAANLEFADYYVESIETHEKLLDGYMQNPASAASDAFSICDVSKLVLDYLYSGQTEKAWETLYQIYPAEMADQFKAKILAGLEDNVFYEEP